VPDEKPVPESAPAPAAPAAGTAPAAAAAKQKVPTAQKRLRQAARRRAMRTPIRTGAKHAVAYARRLVEDGGKDTEAAVKEALAVLDRAASKGVIHRNNAARRKSRLVRALHKGQAGKKG
jgi:small subunit ribosomal protein S20